MGDGGRGQRKGARRGAGEGGEAKGECPNKGPGELEEFVEAGDEGAGVLAGGAGADGEGAADEVVLEVHEDEGPLLRWPRQPRPTRLVHAAQPASHHIPFHSILPHPDTPQPALLAGQGQGTRAVWCRGRGRVRKAGVGLPAEKRAPLSRRRGWPALPAAPLKLPTPHIRAHPSSPSGSVRAGGAGMVEAGAGCDVTGRRGLDMRLPGTAISAPVYPIDSNAQETTSRLQHTITPCVGFKLFCWACTGLEKRTKRTL